MELHVSSSSQNPGDPEAISQSLEEYTFPWFQHFLTRHSNDSNCPLADNYEVRRINPVFLAGANTVHWRKRLRRYSKTRRRPSTKDGNLNPSPAAVTCRLTPDDLQFLDYERVLRDFLRHYLSCPECMKQTPDLLKGIPVFLKQRLLSMMMEEEAKASGRVQKDYKSKILPEPSIVRISTIFGDVPPFGKPSVDTGPSPLASWSSMSNMETDHSQHSMSDVRSMTEELAACSVRSIHPRSSVRAALRNLPPKYRPRRHLLLVSWNCNFVRGVSVPGVDLCVVDDVTKYLEHSDTRRRRHSYPGSDTDTPHSSLPPSGFSSLSYPGDEDSLVIDVDMFSLNARNSKPRTGDDSGYDERGGQSSSSSNSPSSSSCSCSSDDENPTSRDTCTVPMDVIMPATGASQDEAVKGLYEIMSLNRQRQALTHAMSNPTRSSFIARHLTDTYESLREHVKGTSYSKLIDYTPNILEEGQGSSAGCHHHKNYFKAELQMVQDANVDSIDGTVPTTDPPRAGAPQDAPRASTSSATVDAAMAARYRRRLEQQNSRRGPIWSVYQSFQKYYRQKRNRDALKIVLATAFGIILFCVITILSININNRDRNAGINASAMLTRDATA